ncbi:Nucleotide-binding universal stress protein, UspA family [Hyunsoonleella jejuensis]|uniref:Nucleotide-binding universal stress protein, UspA family n=1 Tax=Hyunsoonleella jejuensis TaxID=419940 RepID=A0A1H9FD18_9FLAO|nr:universal stress protein [Hyunsoonleella jejuensis]SEQ35218.1 Nucleotide-binding universal stress protein, UspA family [Hyunsoonleella jejuensis]
MKRHILIPTDFSANSWGSIGYGLKLFKDEECSFYLLNATTLKASAMSNLSNKLLKTMKANALKELEEMKDIVENNNANANHDFEIILSGEELNKAIKTAIKKCNIDLIIMGTKGATGAKEIFFGSNTVRIVNDIKDCPILIVPEDYNFVVPKQIAFPTDFNRFYNDNDIQPLKEFADLYNSKIRIVHINEEEELNDVQEYNLEVLQEHLIDYEHSLHWMPKYAKKSKEINDFIEELEIDMLAMVNYERSFIEKIIREPIIKKIGFRPIVPFVVIPE